MRQLLREGDRGTTIRLGERPNRLTSRSDCEAENPSWRRRWPNGLSASSRWTAVRHPEDLRPLVPVAHDLIRLLGLIAPPAIGTSMDNQRVERKSGGFQPTRANTSRLERPSNYVIVDSDA